MDRTKCTLALFFLMVLALFAQLQIPTVSAAEGSGKGAEAGKPVSASTEVTAETVDASALDIFNRFCGSAYAGSRQLTREEFCVAIAKVFVKAQGIEALPFADTAGIKPENAGYLAALYERGLLSGSSIGGQLYMLPDDPITRQEAITFLARVLSQSSASTLSFPDADLVAPYAYPGIAWFAENKIVAGYPDGTLGPLNNMTADELAALTLKTLDYYQRHMLSGLGTGMRGSADGIVSAARFTMPYGLAFDRQGVLIVADTYNNMIRTVSGGLIGTVGTYMGKKIQLDENSYQKGYYLDGTLADALLSRPAGVVYNAANEIFIADSGNHVIRFVRQGRVYTFSGTTQGYADGGPKEARFDTPMGIAIDSAGNLYVADTLNYCIRKIDLLGNATTIAGTPGQSGFADGAADKALFLDPTGIAVSSDGRTVYVSDTGNHKIRKIEGGIVTTVAGVSGEADADGYPEGGFLDGAAARAMFNRPTGITLVDGIILVADSGNHRIRVIDRTGAVTTICGNGEPGDEEGAFTGAALNHPMGVCVYDGLLYIADTLNNKIKTMPFNAADY